MWYLYQRPQEPQQLQAGGTDITPDVDLKEDGPSPLPGEPISLHCAYNSPISLALDERVLYSIEGTREFDGVVTFSGSLAQHYTSDDSDSDCLTGKTSNYKDDSLW